MSLFILNTIFNDAPQPWQIGFQDSAAPGFTGIVELHNTIFFYLVVIFVGVFWTLCSIIYYYNSKKSPIVHKYLNHGTLIELIWTITPALILIAIAFPSFRLLYLLDLFKMSEANPLEFMIKISNLPIIPTNYNLIFKFIFLIIFILLSIYLLYQEFLYYDKLNSLHDGSIKQASFKLPQILRDLFLIISAGMGYRTYNRDEVSMPKFKKEEATKELEGTQAENAALNSENESLLDKYKRTLNEVNQKIDSQDRLKVMPMVDKEKEDLSNASNKSTNNLIEEEQPNLYPKVDQILENNINKKFENIGQIEKEFNEEEIKRSGILTYDFDLQKFLDTLSQEEKLAFSGLLLNSLILNYLISIILVLYGDYLIKRFDLENKYPKLAKFIKIRRQLQNYYLKVCFLWIFICIMPQICMYIFIIFPKIVEFIS